MKNISDRDFYSWRSTKGWRTRREGKQDELWCPVCGERMPKGALDHERIKHVDLYQRKAAKRGELV